MKGIRRTETPESKAIVRRLDYYKHAHMRTLRSWAIPVAVILVAFVAGLLTQ